MSNITTKTISLPTVISQGIEQLALKEHRSFSAQVAVILEEKLKSLEKGTAPLFESA